VCGVFFPSLRPPPRHAADIERVGPFPPLPTISSGPRATISLHNQNPRPLWGARTFIRANCQEKRPGEKGRGEEARPPCGESFPSPGARSRRARTRRASLRDTAWDRAD